ncbi:hypothetical protein [Spirillospora albida]|uniref:hypothetical protein n=1 Tax=Spirillospora albida TaxID=58123 RepID=UPI0004C2AB72|nr:hypothetical protein [Spirillospora albida]
MNTIKDELERIAGTAGPAPRVDIAAAAVRGRRIRRIRRTRTGTAVGAVLAGAVGVGAVVLPGPDTERGAGIASAAPSYAEPLVAQATFGWLPDGYRESLWIRDDQGARTFSVLATRVDSPTVGIELSVHRAEPGIGRLPGGREGRRTPAAPVNGRPAYWTVKPGERGSEQVPAEFRWEFRPGRWAVLAITDRRPVTSGMVYRIASATRFADRPVEFPLHIRGFPAGFTVKRAVLSEKPSVSMYLIPKSGKQGGLSITLHRPVRGGTFVPPDGAFKGDTHQGAKGGFLVGFTATGDAVPLVKAKGGARGLFDRTTVLPGTPGRWAARPLG